MITSKTKRGLEVTTKHGSLLVWYQCTQMCMHITSRLSGGRSRMVGSWRLRGQPLLTKKGPSNRETITKGMHAHYTK